MIELAGINVWAMIVAWLINIIVGAFWYSPAGFAKQWTKYTGVDILKIPQDKATKILVAVAFSGLVQAIILAVVVHSLGAATAIDGLVAGLVLWLGLTAATTVGVSLYSRFGWKFWWLNSSYFLVVMAVNSIVLAIWR
jgi:hypothetical protein